MFSVDEPFYALHTAAALASGWPRLRALCPDEASLQSLRATLEDALGPLPQADEVEPFTDGSHDDPWELRVDLPALDATRWEHLRSLLAEVEHELTPGAPPEVTAAEDLGVRWVEWLDGGGLAARMPVAVDDGQQSLDLHRAPDIDEAIAALEIELAAALHRQHPRLQLRSERGTDTVTALVHRTSGRLGVELWLGPETTQGLDGDSELALRHLALAALAEVVHARARHPVLRLAPDPSWGLRLGGLSLIAWIVAPPVAALPGDLSIPNGLSPHPLALGGLLRDAEGLVHDLEVQVVDSDPARAMAAVLEAGGSDWVGASPRWVVHDGRWHFVPTWRAPLDIATASAADRLPGTVRITPGRLVGLEEEDPWLLRQVVWGEQRVALRVRDGVRDRDREPAVVDRPPSPDDVALIGAALQALGAYAQSLVPQGTMPVRPVACPGGRRGVQLAFGPPMVRVAHELLSALTDADGVGPWIDWSLPRGGGLHVHLWHRGQAPDRTWR